MTSLHFPKILPLLACMISVLALNSAHAEPLLLSAEQQQAMGVEARAVTQVASVPTPWIQAEVMVALNKIRLVTAPQDVRVIELRRVHGTVSAGEIIAVLEADAVTLLQTEYLATQAKLDAAKSALKRLKSLSRIGASSVELMQEREAQVIEYEALLAQQEQSLLLAGFSESSIANLKAKRKLQPSRIAIQAPANGEMFDLKASEGQVVEQFQPLFSFGELDPITVHVPVPVELARTLQEGKPAQIQIASGTLTAEITHIERMVDEMTQTVDVHLHLPNPESANQLLPGQKVQVRFLAAKTPAYQAPMKSLAHLDGQNSVLILQPAGDNQMAVKVVPIEVHAMQQGQLFFSPQSENFDAQNVVASGVTAIKLAMSAGEEE